MRVEGYHVTRLTDTPVTPLPAQAAQYKAAVNAPPAQPEPALSADPVQYKAPPPKAWTESGKTDKAHGWHGKTDKAHGTANHGKHGKSADSAHSGQFKQWKEKVYQ